MRASPDGIISCSCHGERLIEVKCPYVHRDKDLKDCFVRNDIEYLDSKLEQPLKRGHTRGYFEQVTGQLAITGLELCDFVVFSKQGILSFPIKFDKYYWEMAMLPKLVRVFEKYIAPELLLRKIGQVINIPKISEDTTESASTD